MPDCLQQSCFPLIKKSFAAGRNLVTFSFLGKAILKAQKEIAGLLEKNGFKLIEVEIAEKGAYILGQKEERNSI